MIDNKTLDDIAARLSERMPDGLKIMQDDAQKNIRAILESALSSMNLVSREEFDVQAALLSRTQNHLHQLEKLLQQLEASMNNK